MLFVIAARAGFDDLDRRRWWQGWFRLARDLTDMVTVLMCSMISLQACSVYFTLLKQKLRIYGI